MGGLFCFCLHNHDVSFGEYPNTHGITMYIFGGKSLLVYIIHFIEKLVDSPREFGFYRGVHDFGKGHALACGFNFHLKGGARSQANVHTPLFIGQTNYDDSWVVMIVWENM